MKDLAVKLERSEQRFLWVVRSPPTKDQSKESSPTPDPDFDSLLPKRFLDRTREKELVVFFFFVDEMDKERGLMVD